MYLFCFCGVQTDSRCVYNFFTFIFNLFILNYLSLILFISILLIPAYCIHTHKRIACICYFSPLESPFPLFSYFHLLSSTYSLRSLFLSLLTFLFILLHSFSTPPFLSLHPSHLSSSPLFLFSSSLLPGFVSC